MALELECQLKVVENLLLGDEPKEEKEFQHNH